MERRKMERYETVKNEVRQVLDKHKVEMAAERQQMQESVTEALARKTILRLPKDAGLLQCVNKLIEMFNTGVPADKLKEAILNCKTNGVH